MKKLFIVFAVVLLLLPLASASTEPEHHPILRETETSMPGEIPETNIRILAVNSLQQANSSLISDCVQITQPGYYILTRNISAAQDSCLYINSSDVVIDGNGYAIVGSGWSGTWYVRWYGIFVENAVNITLKNLIIESFDIGIYFYNVSLGLITNNTILNNSLEGIFLDSSSNNNTITNNTILNNGGGINLPSSSSNLIADNIIIFNNNGYGIFLASSPSNLIINNTISNNWKGLYLESSSSNTITNNTFINNGILPFDSFHNTITNNTVNGKPLVYLENVRDYTVTDAGQVVAINSKNITISNLNLSYTDIGIFFYNTSDSLITNNTISNNGDGIYLSHSSDNNTIYLNTFTSNSQHVEIWDSSNNIWNSTHPITYTYNNSTFTNYMGNYWDDYTGSDSDGDGIGDTPYQITSTDKDLHPLIAPSYNYFSTSSPAPPEYTLILPDISLQPNQTAQIPVSISAQANITGINFTLLYNSSIIHILDAKSLFSSSLWANIDNTSGTARIAVVFNSSLSGNATILNLTVKAILPGTSPLAVSKAEISNENFNVTSINTINGSVTVLSLSKGDINGDGRIDITDAALVAYMVMGKVQPDKSADFNGNGKVDIGDLAKIVYYIMGRISDI